MATLLLTSLLFATVLIPLYTSRDLRPHLGLRWTVIATLLFLAVYLFTCIVIYNRL